MKEREQLSNQEMREFQEQSPEASSVEMHEFSFRDEFVARLAEAMPWERSIIKNWLPEKGYGFIPLPSGGDAFIHRSALIRRDETSYDPELKNKEDFVGMEVMLRKVEEAPKGKKLTNGLIVGSREYARLVERTFVELAKERVMPLAQEWNEILQDQLEHEPLAGEIKVGGSDDEEKEHQAIVEVLFDDKLYELACSVIVRKENGIIDGEGAKPHVRFLDNPSFLPEEVAQKINYSEEELSADDMGGYKENYDRNTPRAGRKFINLVDELHLDDLEWKIKEKLCSYVEQLLEIQEFVQQEKSRKIAKLKNDIEEELFSESAPHIESMLKAEPFVDKADVLDWLSRAHANFRSRLSDEETKTIYEQYVNGKIGNRDKSNHAIYSRACKAIAEDPQDLMAWQVLRWCYETGRRGSRSHYETYEEPATAHYADETWLTGGTFKLTSQFWKNNIDFPIPHTLSDLPSDVDSALWEELQLRRLAKQQQITLLQEKKQIISSEAQQIQNEIKELGRKYPELVYQYELPSLSEFNMRSLHSNTEELAAFEEKISTTKTILPQIDGKMQQTYEKRRKDTLEREQEENRQKGEQILALKDFLPDNSENEYTREDLEMAMQAKTFTEAALNALGGNTNLALKLLEQEWNAPYGRARQQAGIRENIFDLTKTEVGNNALLFSRASDWSRVLGGAVRYLTLIQEEKTENDIYENEVEDSVMAEALRKAGLID